jgi:type I restriction enzyme, S subunit
MSEWKEILLGEVIEVVNGYAFKSSDFLESKIDNSLPVIKIKNVANGDVHLNGCQFHKYNQSLDKFVVKTGDVLLALTGNHPEVMTQVVGEASRYKLSEKAFLNQRVAKVLPKDSHELNNDFLYYFLKDDNTHDYIASQSTGSANQANISKVDIENIPLNLPPLPEQAAIAEVLSSLDDKIDLLHRQNKTLEQLAETLFRQWFMHRPELAEGEEAEESWKEITFGELAKPKKGKNLTKSEAVNGEFPVVAGGIEPSCYHNKANTKSPVITVSASGANAGYVRLYHTPVWSSDSSYIDETITPYVYFSYVFLKVNQRQLTDKQEGSAQPHIYPSHIMELDMLNYPEKLIEKFEKEVTPLFHKIKSNTQQIRTLTQLRDTLLPKLMSGEVRVNIKDSIAT